MTGQDKQFFTRFGVPDPGGAVCAGGQNPAFILVHQPGIKCPIPEWSGVTTEGQQFLTRVGIPDLGRAVPTEGEDTAAAWVPLRRGQVGMTGQGQ